MREFQPWSRKEAVGTAISASILTMQANLLAKSPLLRAIPGAGILQERAEFKRRQRYEQTGRDETGRKLTKQEFEDREKKRRDLGALGDLKDLIVDKWGVDGVPTYEVENPNKRMDQGKQKVITPSEEGAYALEEEERAKEKEKEDDADADRMEKKQENFFTKLFGKKPGEKKEGGGLFSGLMDLLGSVKGWLAGGLTGLIDLVLGAIGTAAAAILPILGAIALPAVAILLGGAVGLAIAKWIGNEADKYRAKADAETKQVMEQGYATKTATNEQGEKIYKITDKDGNTKFGTAKDLGLNKQQLEGISKEGFAESNGGRISESTYRVETQGGKETGRLAKGLSGNEIVAAGMAKGTMSTAEASGKSAGEKKMMEVERSMAEYSADFSNAIANSTDDSAKALGLVNDFNSILSSTKMGINKYPEVFTADRLRSLVKKYGIFGNAIANGKVRDGMNAYIDKDTGIIGRVGSDWDALDADDLVIPGVGSFTFGSKSTTAEGWSKQGGGVDTVAPILPATPTGSDISTNAATNAALKSAPAAAPTMNTTANSVQQTNNTVVASAPTTSRTGADTPPRFNG
jgi:hypothetical protein